MSSALVRIAAVAMAALLHATSAFGEVHADLYFGEALYHAYRGHYFEALERLDTEVAQHYGVDEPELDSLHPFIGHAEFSVGDFELRYRMHHRGGRAIKAVLEADVPEEIRNEAASRLARIHFQKGQAQEALTALEGIRGRIPEDIREDTEFLRANIYLASGRPADAVAVLRKLQDSESLKGFAGYNLGIALLQAGQQAEAIEQLDKAGRVDGDDQSVLAIRDKSNLVLGTLLFEASEYGLAQQSLDRVRLMGPFSNQALLRAGWSDASADRFERAVVPWAILSEREATDAAVQEALLALPYAYSQLQVHGRAAVLYGRAVETFGEELAKVDASIRSVSEKQFLKALVREEVRQTEDWVIRLRELPEAPETFYLMTLMASHDFQTALQNYLDLEDMRKKLVSWQGSLNAFDDIIRLRRDYYEPLLPEIDREFRKLDTQMHLRLEQRKHVDQRLKHLLIAPRPDYLATAAERIASQQINEMEASLQDAGHSQVGVLTRRVQRLKGVLSWNLETQYHQRLTDAHEHLRKLDEEVNALRARYESFVRARQTATHSYVGYEEPINSLRAQIGEALEKLTILMARQGHILETVAKQQLKLRKERLETYLNQARFAFADSYDRAAKTQVQ